MGQNALFDGWETAGEKQKQKQEAKAGGGKNKSRKIHEKTTQNKKTKGRQIQEREKEV